MFNKLISFFLAITFMFMSKIVMLHLMGDQVTNLNIKGTEKQNKVIQYTLLLDLFWCQKISVDKTTVNVNRINLNVQLEAIKMQFKNIFKFQNLKLKENKKEKSIKNTE